MLRLIVMYVLLIPCAGAFIYEHYKTDEKHKLIASVFKGIATWIALGGALAGMLGRGAEPHVYMILIAAGLAMGLAGDVALSLPDPGFMAGMIFFGLGHLTYIAALIIVSSWALLAIPIFVVAYTIALFVLFAMKKKGKCPEELLVPVIIYSGIILVMVSLAATMPISAFPKGFVLIAAAILFAVSDAMLARNKFAAVIAAKLAAKDGGDHAPQASEGRGLTPVERSTVSLCCYFLAQSLFAVSIYVLF